jgi:hypothetical protein
MLAKALMRSSRRLPALHSARLLSTVVEDEVRKFNAASSYVCLTVWLVGLPSSHSDAGLLLLLKGLVGTQEHDGRGAAASDQPCACQVHPQPRDWALRPHER